jgi:hypothetical protein
MGALTSGTSLFLALTRHYHHEKETQTRDFSSPDDEKETHKKTSHEASHWHKGSFYATSELGSGPKRRYATRVPNWTSLAIRVLGF